MRADLNVIDYERLTFGPPRMVHDLPAGARRLVQKASGYVATFVDGVQTVDRRRVHRRAPRPPPPRPPLRRGARGRVRRAPGQSGGSWDVRVALVEEPVVVGVDEVERRGDRGPVGLQLGILRGRDHHVLDAVGAVLQA